MGVMLSIFLVLSSFLSKEDTRTSFDECFNQNTSFQDGEVLLYRIYYNWNLVWVPAGEVKFTMRETNDAYHYEAIGKSYSSYESIFRVNDYYASSIDKTTMLPKTFVRHIEEGNYRKFDSLTFDQAALTVHSINGKTKAKAHEKSFDIDGCALDLLSVMYSLRNENIDEYNKGDYLDINMFFDKENYPVHVVYDGKERKKVRGLGTFDCIRVQPELIAGNVFNEGDEMNIWVTDDQNKIPVMIETPISVGSIKAVLLKHKGLRHESELDK